MEGRDEGAISAVVRPGDQRRGKKIVERERGKETRREMAKVRTVVQSLRKRTKEVCGDGGFEQSGK